MGWQEQVRAIDVALQHIGIPTGSTRHPEGQTQAVSQAPGCLRPEQVEDGDGDFVRHRAALSEPGLCITQTSFDERGVTWRLQIVKSDRTGPLWVVPHDNENSGFDTAVFGLTHYGGVIVAVETNGERFNGPIDPNRNFSADGIGCAAIGNAASPKFVSVFMDNLAPGEPVFALHSNAKGSSAYGGSGNISMKTPYSNATPYPARKVVNLFRNDDTMIFVATVGKPSREITGRVAALNEQGINVMLESVSPQKSDCSMSNYMVLTGRKDYLNLEVVHGDNITQEKMLQVVMSTLFPRLAERATATSQ
jgi:hypothetical protein